MNRAVNNDTRQARLRIGVQACLPGRELRFDGDHRRSRMLTDTLADYSGPDPDYPEATTGTGVPRQPVCPVPSPSARMLRYAVQVTRWRR
jgi:uncharacterized protein YbbK (DUF523 family)